MMCLDNFSLGVFRKKVTNFTFLTNYFSIEHLLTMKWIIIYTLHDNKVRANNVLKYKEIKFVETKISGFRVFG